MEQIRGVFLFCCYTALAFADVEKLKPSEIGIGIDGSKWIFTNRVKAHGRNIIAVALEKFTIPDAKYLGIQLMEKNGGRHLLMKLQNKHLLKANMLPDLR